MLSALFSDTHISRWQQRTCESLLSELQSQFSVQHAVGVGSRDTLSDCPVLERLVVLSMPVPDKVQKFCDSLFAACIACSPASFVLPLTYIGTRKARDAPVPNPGRSSQSEKW